MSWSIGRLRGGFCLVWYEDGKRRRRALGTSDASAARQIAPAVYHELTRPKGSTVAALWSAYTADMKGRSVVTTMAFTWKAIGPAFKTLEPRDITIEHCREYARRRRAEGKKDGTIHTELGHLRMVLLWAAKRRLIDAAPHIERPSATKPQGDKHLTREELRRLLDACDMPHIKMFTHLAYATAGRASALLGLTWDRVDFERGKIDLRDPALTKRHKGRAIVPMTATLRAVLSEQHQLAMSPFVIEWAGKRVASVKRGLASAAARAGVRRVTHHQLRHTAAVHMAEAGVPMEEIASYLGHSNPSVTRSVYARYSPDSLRHAAAALEMSGPVGPRENFAKRR
jgi:integrase